MRRCRTTSGREWCSACWLRTPVLARVAVPTLVLWGDRDPILGREEQERLIAALPAARLQAFPGLGYDPPTSARTRSLRPSLDSSGSRYSGW